MFRNLNSRFSQVPIDINIQRSRFDRSCTYKTTFNAGQLIPCYLSEVLPGDTVDMQFNHVTRMSTPIFPVMDSAWLDTYFFFIPARLLWTHWEAFNGQNDENYWTVQNEYQIPQLKAPENGWDKGSLADYFGIPTQVPGTRLFYYYDSENDTNVIDEAENLSVNALPFRAYVKVWNDWFRDQNTMDPAYFTMDDSNRVGRRNDHVVNDLAGQPLSEPLKALQNALYGGTPLYVSKYHDYFTSSLPSSQKGNPVSVPTSGMIPVVTSGKTHSVYDPEFALASTKVNSPTLSFSDTGYLSSGDSPIYVSPLGKSLLDNDASDSIGSSVDVVPNNLYADFTGLNSFGNDETLKILVNDMRTAFQIQRLFEKDARGGTRYIEVIKSHFGIDSPDGRLQRSEYLGGNRQAINISQVVQTSSTDVTSPQGNTSAYSLTVGSDNSFIKSFTEHGYLIGVCCVRTDHTYQQGLNKLWSRKRRFDFYWPALANIGEQAILRKEILCTDTVNQDENGVGEFVNDMAFGYQEAWAEYRYHPNMVTGAFRSNVSGTLDSWHYADNFDPNERNFVISSEFLFETPTNIGRTLAVPGEDQFISDMLFKSVWTRPMPMYSVPGLIDHH